MLAYLLRRIAVFIPLLLAISFLTFLLLQSVPGNYFDRLRLDPLISEQTIAAYQKQYHLDKPVAVQYLHWVKNLARGDFGYSFELKQPVWNVIKGRWANTLLLSLSALFCTWLLAIPLGIHCAVRQYAWSDKIFSFVSFVGMSMPNFFFALLLLTFAGGMLQGLLPLGGMQSADAGSMSPLGKVLDLAHHLLLPTLVISFGSIAALQRVMRGNLLEVLRAQYVTTARAKGLPEHRVIYAHALRNAANPMITLFGGELSGLLSGAALTEILCGWPGLGSLMLNAVRSQDVFLVMGSSVLGAVMLMAGTLAADVLLALNDPRIALR